MNNGKVLIAGGGNPGAIASTQIYDPVAKTFSAGGNLATARFLHTASLMSNGSVLVAGGDVSSGNVTATTELSDPASQTFTGTRSLATARGSHTATRLNDGTVLIVGGIGNNSTILSSAELYGPPPPPPVSLHINPATVTLLLGQSLQCVVVDEVGRQRYDATWSVSAPLATLSTDTPPILTATGYGQLTLIATVAGVSAQAQVTVAPSSVQVTPTTVNVQVGETRQFTAVDNFGNPVPAAITWSVSDSSLASISTGSSPSLTANAVGQASLTATVEGVSGQAQVTISAAGQLAPGSVLWSVPPPPEFSPLQIVQAVPTPNAPIVYSIGTNGSLSVLQALTSDGQQLWQTLLPAVNGNGIPDGSGGMIVTERQTCYQNQKDPMTIVDLDSTGKQKWQIQATGVQNGNAIVYCYQPSSTPQFAVRNDGSVIMAEPNNGGLPPVQVVDQLGSATQVQIPFSTIKNSSGVMNVQSLYRTTCREFGRSCLCGISGTQYRRHNVSKQSHFCHRISLAARSR